MTPPSNAKRMVCCVCGLRILATLAQAKRHGWALWVGGGTCKRCTEEERRQQIDRAPAHDG